MRELKLREKKAKDGKQVLWTYTKEDGNEKFFIRIVGGLGKRDIFYKNLSFSSSTYIFNNI